MVTRGRTNTFVCFNSRGLFISLTLIEPQDVEAVLASSLISSDTRFNKNETEH